MRTFQDFACACGAALVAACSSTGDVALPLVSREGAFAPVEGLESTALSSRAHAAILSGSGDKPIEVTIFPANSQRQHALRGELVALAGPAPDGRFVYMVRDDRFGLALHRADLCGADRHVLRFPRSVSALALAPDAEHAAILAEFEESDPRSRGGVLRELVLLELSTGDARRTGLACWDSTPAWLDATRVACVIAEARSTPAENDAAGAKPATGGVARSIVLVDLFHPAEPRRIGAGDGVLAERSPASLLAFRRTERGLSAVRLGLDGGAETPLELRGALQPLAVAGDDLIASFSAPTLGTEPQWQVDLFGPQIALATIKLHDLATGDFQTIDPRASPRRLWSAGRLAD
jgi:hypothetical protein